MQLGTTALSPPPSDYDGDGDTEIGSGTASTGSSSDTAIASVFTSPFSTSEAAKLGNELINGVIYSKFKIATATFTVDQQTLTTGESTPVSFLLRTGTSVIRPQKFWLDNTNFTSTFDGNDPALGQATPVVITVSAGSTNTGGNTPPPDTTPPTAALGAVSSVGSDTAGVDFPITFSDESGINPVSIVGSDVTITNGTGFSEDAILLFTRGNSNDLTAHFRALGPNGIFSDTANGRYTITLNPDSVRDIFGNGVAGGVLGAFDVDVPAPPSGPNLGGAILSIPKVIVPSSKNNKVIFRVANSGNVDFSGNVAVKVYASASGAVDKKSIVLVKSATLSNLNLPVNTSTNNITLTFTAPAKAIDAQYHLIIVLDPANLIAEQFKSDNTVVSPTTVRLAGPTADLSPAFVGTIKTLSRKKKSAVNVKITNTGNVTAKGPAKIQLFAVVGKNQVQIASLSTSLTLAALAAKVFKLTVDASKVPAGSHVVRALVTFTGKPGDTVAANNSVSSTSGVAFV